MKKLTALTPLLFLLMNSTFAQLQIHWQQCYGGSEYEEAVDIYKTEEGYLVFGSTHSTDGQVSNNYRGNDYWIVQTDSMGNVIWDKNFGGTRSDFLWDAFYAANNTDFYLVGNSASVDHDISYDPYGGYDGWVIKLDSMGNTDWDFTMGTPAFEFINGARQTGDGGYIACLSGKPTGTDRNIDCVSLNGSVDAILYKIDADGNGV